MAGGKNVRSKIRYKGFTAFPQRRTPKKLARNSLTLKMIQSFSRKTLLYVTLIILTAIGFFIRIYKINDLPQGLYFDEANSANIGLQLLEQKQLVAFTPKATGHPTPLFYLMAESTKIFGHSNLAVRLPSIVFGSLDIPATFF